MNIQQQMTRSSLCLLAWCTLAVATACAQTITHVPLFTIDGDSFNQGIGTSVSGAGDVNGDGVADLIVGSSGRARVFSGTDGSLLSTFFGSGAFGGSVSGAGDVNGDGFADLIVGAPLHNINGTASGRAQVISGVDGSVLYFFDGDSALDLFGTSVSDAGDVNGDGFADLIVGASISTAASSSLGYARVFSGSDGSILHNFEGIEFVRSVSGAGDVNGDGFADVIVGAADFLGPTNGRAQVFSGGDGSVLYSFDGDSAGDSFGLSVSGAGDVNGDGFADLIVGAPGDDNNGTFSGSARVLSGVDGSILYNFEGSEFSAMLGQSVSDAGDVNGDGFDDLIVGIPVADNNNTDSGTARVFSGVDGSVLYSFDGDTPLDNFGTSVSGVGDINGDGLADFIVSGESRLLSADNGYVRVFVSQITPSVLKGDVNLDGVVDFFDLAPFIGVLQSRGYQAEADLNCDGDVNFLDISEFLPVFMVQ